MGSRLKRPMGSKAAKAEKAKALHAMATANAVKQMAVNVASLVASYDRKNDNEVKRVKMEETRSAVAMYMGMGMLQEAQRWAAQFAEDLTNFREPPPPPPPVDEPLGETEPVGETVARGIPPQVTAPRRRTGASSSTRGTRSSATNNRNSTTNSRLASTTNNGRVLNRNRVSATPTNTITTTTPTSAPPQPSSPNLLADDSSSEETDIHFGQPEGRGAVSSTRRVIPPPPPARARVTQPQPPPPATPVGVVVAHQALYNNNNDDWLLGSQLTIPHHQEATRAETTDEVYQEREASTHRQEVRRGDRRDEEFGTAESTVIIFGDA